MSHSVESEPVETLEFKWGKKKGRGGKKKEVQFYESFKYDGVDYTLYDIVYLYKEDEPDPYIGKLIKIWENEDQTEAKKVKVHWFFRPSEISNWIEEGMVLEKEIFLASGEGVCAASVNPLEAISGKCNVVCTLKDERNPQPSAQELELADHFFYRTFDVEQCTISDIIDDKVAGLEVKFLFNRKEDKSNTGAISDKKQEGEKATYVDAINLNSVAINSFQRTLSKSKATSLSTGFENVKTEKPNASLVKAKVDDEIIVSIGSGSFGNRLASKSMADGSEASHKNMNAKNVETLTLDINESKALNKSSSFTDKKMKSGERKGSVEMDKVVKAAKADNPIIKSEAKNNFQNLDATSDKNGGKNLSTGLENVKSEKPNASLVKAKVDDEVIVSIGSGSLGNRFIKSVADSEASHKNMNAKNVETLTLDINESKALNKSSSFTDKKMKSGERKGSVELDKVVKAAKADNPIIKSEAKNSYQNLDATSDKNGGKNLATVGRKRNSDDDCLGPDKVSKQPKTEEKMVKLSDGKLQKVDREPVREESEADKFEVTRRPDINRKKWFRPPPWEESIKSAYEQGTLVQLSNLDSGYTSSEVEDIIWHAFKEHCTAKMVQRTTTSNPHYGHAHIIMKTKVVADMIIKRLEEGCLMLPNGRPLVGSRASPLSFPGKQSTFIGHLSVDKLRHQMQRDMRDAVSTSHCSQPNTIEFEMALEWCLLQSRSDSWWKRLYKQQGEELRKLKANLKLK